MMKITDCAIKNLFPTPLVTVTLSGTDDVNRLLKEIVLKRRAESDGVRISNHGGWQSDDRIMEWGGAPVKNIVDAVVDLLGQITLVQEGTNIERRPLRWRVHGWANINRKGDINVMHCHPGAFWSAVYYVQVDEGADGTPIGGELELLDPRGSMPLLYSPHLRFGIKGYVSAGTSELHVPHAGQLIIFPSWLTHAVSPYKGDDERISMAFNFSI